MRVFLDTNVLVAAFATRGLCSDLLRLVLAEHQLIMTKVLVAELDRVLESTIGLPPGQRTEVIEFLSGCLVPETAPAPSPAGVLVRDVDDIEVVRFAIAAEADVLVTGDRDPLEAELALGAVNPRGFWSLLRARRAEPTAVHEP